MKSVIKDLSQEIDYLSALAEMYRQGGDVETQAAALEAIAALERLVCLIKKPSNSSCPEFPAAA